MLQRRFVLSHHAILVYWGTVSQQHRLDADHTDAALRASAAH
jgi:hypothetical protein